MLYDDLLSNKVLVVRDNRAFHCIDARNRLWNDLTSADSIVNIICILTALLENNGVSILQSTTYYVWYNDVLTVWKILKSIRPCCVSLGNCNEFSFLIFEENGKFIRLLWGKTACLSACLCRDVALDCAWACCDCRHRYEINGIDNILSLPEIHCFCLSVSPYCSSFFPSICRRIVCIYCMISRNLEVIFTS